MDSSMTEGQMQFPRTYTEDVDDDHMMGYRPRDGRSLLYFHTRHHDAPALYSVSDADAP